MGVHAYHDGVGDSDDAAAADDDDDDEDDDDDDGDDDDDSDSEDSEDGDSEESETENSDSELSEADRADPAIVKAFLSYKEAKQKLRDKKSSRQFYSKDKSRKAPRNQEEITKLKESTTCRDCGEAGHWAGDPERKSPGKDTKKRHGKRGKQYMVSVRSCSWSVCVFLANFLQFFSSS